MGKNNNGRQENFEQAMFNLAEKLRENIGASEYKPIGK
jgi:hypothetical protein